MLRNNCLYVFHAPRDGLRARVCDCRTKGGAVQVKHLASGTWHSLGDGSRIVQQ